MAEEAFMGFDDDEKAEQSLSGETSPGVGAFHMQVTHVDEFGGKNGDQMVTSFTVLSPGDYEGMTYRDYGATHNKDWARKRRYKLAIVLGLVTLDQIKKGGAQIEWQDAVGKECVVVLEENTWKKQDTGEVVHGNPKAKWAEHFISCDDKAGIAKHGCKMSTVDAPRPTEPEKTNEKSDVVPF